MGNSLCADKEPKKPAEYFSKQKVSLFSPDHDSSSVKDVLAKETTKVKSVLCDKGQRFLLVDDSFGSWWTMKTMVGEKEVVGTASKLNFYPVNSDKDEDREDWFFGDMMRSEAEELLSHSANDQGSFLVRHSTKHKKLVLSVKIFDEELLVYQYKHFSIR